MKDSTIGNEPAINIFDLNGYTCNHCIFDGIDKYEIKRLQKINKKVPGKMKDKLNGKTLLEFAGLRAKSYAFRWLDIKYEIHEEKKLKGIKKCVVKTNVNFNHYKSALYEKKTHIASLAHYVLIYIKYKLSPFVKSLQVLLMIKDIYLMTASIHFLMDIMQ